MLNDKKKISKIKTENFLQEFPLIFLVQQNNLTLKEWFSLKQQIQELSQEASSCCKIITTKNTVLKKSLDKLHCSSVTKLENHQEILNSMCQGPSFLLGCHKETLLQPLWNCIQSNPKLVFISCFYKNQLVNHLDFEILLKTTPSVYQTFLHQVDKKTELYTTLQSPLNFQLLVDLQHQLLLTLNALKS